MVSRCYFTILFSFAALGGGCAGNGDGKSAPVSDGAAALPSGLWRVTAHGDPAAPEYPVAGTEITLDFNHEEGRISGSAGCNRFGGTFSVDGSELSFGPLMATKKMCLEPEGVMAQENMILGALQAVTRFSREGDRATLHYGEGQGLVLSRVEPAAGRAEPVP